jgi:glycosyltransferase involved in cell wall biosynthesis
LQRFLARQAIATIVTNEYFQQLVERRGGRAFVLRDIPTSFDLNGTYPLNGGFNIAVVNSFAKDEPLDEVLAAAGDLADVNFYVTGKQELAPPSMLARAPANVRFTGFLPDATYYALLNGAHAVVCLTTRDHTMQRGACEALSLGRPIITSDWPLLKMYFHKGTIHVPNTGAGIRQGVLKMQGHHAMYQAEIKDLQIAQQREWREKIEALTRLIEGVVSVD